MINFHWSFYSILWNSWLERALVQNSYKALWEQSLEWNRFNFINPEKSLVSCSNQLNLLTKGNSKHLTPSYSPLDGEPDFTYANVHHLVKMLGQTGSLTRGNRAFIGPQRCRGYHYGAIKLGPIRMAKTKNK